MITNYYRDNYYKMYYRAPVMARLKRFIDKAISSPKVANVAGLIGGTVPLLLLFK